MSFVVKLLSSSIIVGMGFWIPTLLPGDRILACERERKMVNCEVQQHGGGTLFRTGTTVVDRDRYDNIRKAEVVIVNAERTYASDTFGGDRVEKVQLQRLILVSGSFKYPIKLSSEEESGLATTIANQINLLNRDSSAPKLLVSIGEPSWLPHVIGGVTIAIGVLIFLTKDEKRASGSLFS